MRAHGCIDSARGLGPSDHACWGFDEPHEFAEATLEFLSDGLRLEQRLLHVGSEPVAAQRERLDPLGDVGAMVDRGELLLIELGSVYRAGEPIDVDAQVALYATAARAARADGYAGVRVASQATEFVADPETWEDRLRWESAADRVLAAEGISALCGYHRAALPSSLLADLAAVHPVANAGPGVPPFHLFGAGDGLALAGEVDFFSSVALDRLLDLLHVAGEHLSLDLAPLAFIDHRGLEVIAAHARRLSANGGCSIHNPPPVVERLRDLLGLEL